MISTFAKTDHSGFDEAGFKGTIDITDDCIHVSHNDESDTRYVLAFEEGSVMVDGNQLTYRDDTFTSGDTVQVGGRAAQHGKNVDRATGCDTDTKIWLQHPTEGMKSS